MNRTNKKGFTLVELLVVIAILAILATVSVVGYTAFIERATVSNDENVAAQLNQFLTAMKADSTGEFYNQTVTEENVWKVVDTALKQNGGISELEPQSLEYGYHYFFDITDQKFIVLKENDAGITKPGFKAMPGLGFSTGAADEEKPGFFKYNAKDADGNTVQHTIFLIDTKGSSLAIAVRGFYTFEGIEPKEGKTVWETFTDALEDSKSQQNNIDYAKKTIFVTKDGNKTTTADDKIDKTNAVVHEGATSITTDNGADFSKVENDIVVPNSVKVITNDVLEDLSGEGKPSLVSGKTVEEIAGMLVEKNDGSVTVTVKANVNDTTTTITITVENKKNKVSDGTNTADGSFKNPVKSVTINVNEFQDKVKLLEKKDENGVNVLERIVYVAWDYALENDINFTFEAKGQDRDIPASYENVSWKLGKSDASGSIKFTDNADQIVSIDVDGESASITVKFVYLTGGTVKVNDSDKLELENDDQNGGNTDFVVTLNNLSQNTTVDGITLDTSFVLSTNSTKLAICGAEFRLSGVKDLYDATHLNAKVGGYLDIGFDVKVYSKSNLTFVATSLANQIKYIGDDNAITIKDLFALNDGMTLPTNAELHFTTDWADSSNMPGIVPADKQNNSKFVDKTNTKSTITDSSWESQALRFQGGAANAKASGQTKVGCYIVIPEGDGYRRISPVVTLQVVDAYNLKNGDTNQTVFSTDTDPDNNEENNGSGDNHHKVTNQSVVLIGNYTVGRNGYMNLASGKTIYGNNFTMYFNGDTGNGANTDNAARNNSSYVIRLNNSTMLDLKIIGNEFSETNDTWKLSYHSDIQNYSAATIHSNGGTIKNCYISHGRSALRVTNTTTIEDTVLFGGRYANLDIQDFNGTVTLKNVTTVNNTTSNGSNVGMGILVANSALRVTIDIGGTFNQYNFVAKTDIDKLPDIKVAALADDVGIMLKDVFKGMFNECALRVGLTLILVDKINELYNVAEPYLFDNKTCINSGIMFMKSNASDAENAKIKGLPTGYAVRGMTVSYLRQKGYATIATYRTDVVPEDFDVTKYMEGATQYAPDTYQLKSIK